MGIMSSPGRSPADVLRWPADMVARRALEEYFDTLAGLPQDHGAVLEAWGLDFTGADLSGLELAGAQFTEAILDGVRFVGSRLSGVWLIEASLPNADLSQCNLRKASARHCRAQDGTFHAADVQRAEFEDADLRRADMSGARFSGARFSGADLRGASLRDCTFGLEGRSAGFPRARLAECQLDGATGLITGPIDVGVDSPRLLDGPDLKRWFADQGAPLVEIRELVRS